MLLIEFIVLALFVVLIGEVEGLLFFSSSLFLLFLVFFHGGITFFDIALYIDVYKLGFEGTCLSIVKYN